MPPDTDVVVVGGGATGCGVARDLAMRGLDVTLVERGSLNAGTTGRSHGLLHSGARYADADPESARACHEESRILRCIARGVVDDTGGYFLQLPGDDGAYFERKMAASRDCGIEVTAVDVSGLLADLPDVAADVVRAFRVPDAVVYPARLVAATAASAREHGTRLLTGTEVTDIEPGRDGVTVELDGRRSGTDVVTADHVVNAAGPWAGQVAGLADVEVGMAPTRGTMVALDHDGLGTVLNRCRPPDDGDILVPHPASVVCGTTSEPVDDPDEPTGGAEPDGTAEAVERLRSQAAAMVPALDDAATVRAFSGVRPLYAQGGRDATRGFHVLDHADRDGVGGLTTVVGGKLTTYRVMAEAVADRVVSQLGVDAPCRTAEEPLPGHDDPERLDALVAELGTVGPADVDVVAGTSSTG